MKLYGSPTSPFVRKCRITAIECGLQDQIEFMTVNVLTGVGDHPNPLKMVPSLQADGGELIVDSRVICDYLAAQGTPLPATADIWADQTLLALADGMTDRAVSITLERRRPDDEQSPAWLAHCASSILATVPELEKRLPDAFTPGAIALICALAYLDFRHSDLNWRAGHDALARWFDDAAKRLSVLETGPPQ